MEFLRLLEGIRTPILDKFFSVITYLGDETAFMVLAIVLFWCISKRHGYYCFFVGFAGVAISQFMKLWYRIPRPWVIDPGFTIVESARAAATGYSFPSGHSQNAVGTLCVMAMAVKQKWIKALCLLSVVLVPFSRMYLGVHTPLDVGIGAGIALLLVILLHPFCKGARELKSNAWWIFLVLCFLCAVYFTFVSGYPFPADVDAENLLHGTKNAYTLCGCVLGLVLTYVVDTKVINFSPKAPFLGQVCKLLLGLAIVMGLRLGLKSALLNLLGDNMFNDAIRYFVMVLFCGCIWPMTFPLWAKVGKK